MLVLQGRYRCLGPDCIRPWLAMSDAWQVSFDRATPALISLAAVEAGVDGVRLAWLAGGELLASYELERRDADSGWGEIAGLVPDGRGRLEYLDRDVVPGTTYRYRLALGGGAYAGETEVRVPAAPALALFGVSPNPASGRAVARFALPAGGRAALEVLDLTGRRAAARDFAQLPAGSHEVALPEIGTLPPGLYFLRLTYGGEARIRRFSVTR
jgi:hypothetical protein